MRAIRTAICLLAASALSGVASAQMSPSQVGPLRVGLMFTLSGPAAVLGEQGRNGFMLALDELGGKLGGLETNVTTVDDEQKPDVAVTKARELVERDRANFVIGPVFSNILQAIAKPVTSGGAFLISPNAGTSNFAGAECNKNLFVASYQNDQPHEVLGKYAQDQGFKKVFLLAPNYQAGKDSLAGFKHSYKGEVVNEVYTPLGQLDFSAELAQIAAAQPDAVFAFMPGGMGVNLVKQYRQAGLESTPFLSAFTVDETTLPAQRDAALGFLGGANWAPTLDNPQSKAFVAAYEKKFGAVPGTYAMQGYDAAQMIDGAIKAAKGDLANKDAIRAGLEAAEFKSLRGSFKLGANHYPIQDFYLVKAAKRPDGKYQTEIVKTIFTGYADNYGKNCKM